MYRVADQIVEILERAGVKRIYGIVGDSLNPITDALRKKKTIEWIHVRHEEAAAFAASAEAQLSGNLAVCCGSSGPGNLHLINGLFDAHRSHAPVLAIASDIPQSQIGLEYFQATHPEQLFRECSSYAELISEGSQAPRILMSAIQHAWARRDVGVVVLPGDIADAPAEMEDLVHLPSYTREHVVPEHESLSLLARMFDEHRRITFFCGAGCAGAQDKVVRLAHRLKAPIAYTWRGKDYFEHDNPLGIGMTGLLGWGDAYKAMHESDMIVLWGTDFPYFNFIPTKPKIVQIDRRGEVLGRRSRLDLGICGDVSVTAEALLNMVQEKTNSEHLEASLKRHAKDVKDMNAYMEGSDKESPIRPEQLTTALNKYAASDAVFTVDTGTPCIWSARFLCATMSRSMIASFNHGSMANAMPMAMGAQKEYPDRQVIALCGDGGLSMLLGDLITIAQYKLPVKVVVYNNGCLDFIQLEMQAAGLIPWQIDLENPSFSAVADAVGIKGFLLDKSGQVDQMVQTFLSYPGPALLDAHVDRDALALPPYISMGQAADFSLSMMKQTFTGEIKQVWNTLAGNRKLFKP
ncbi:MAG: thiamine pyrophosphate-dependent enzyme [Akkermansiaceae bacterium]|nr:thiamine pyrophosphate-dependent enzyme [Akkermansiaceae bacterium]